MRKQKLPDIPVAPVGQLAPMEAWYLACFTLWRKHQGRSPSLTEMSDYTGKGRSSVYTALCAIRVKGHLDKRKVSGKNRFYLPGDDK